MVSKKQQEGMYGNMKINNTYWQYHNRTDEEAEEDIPKDKQTDTEQITRDIQ